MQQLPTSQREFFLGKNMKEQNYSTTKNNSSISNYAERIFGGIASDRLCAPANQSEAGNIQRKKYAREKGLTTGFPSPTEQTITTQNLLKISQDRPIGFRAPTLEERLAEYEWVATKIEDPVTFNGQSATFIAHPKTEGLPPDIIIIEEEKEFHENNIIGLREGKEVHL